MLSIIWNPIKSSLGNKKNNNSFEGLYKGLLVDEGLRNLISVSNYGGDSNVVVKSGLKLMKPIFHLNPMVENASLYSCFLKSCSLCNKTLRLDKEVYMYRGDQGFCSIICRDRQIYLYEMEELERYSKKMFASFRSCRDSGRWETSTLSEEFESCHKPSSSQRRQVIFF